MRSSCSSSAAVSRAFFRSSRRSDVPSTPMNNRCSAFSTAASSTPPMLRDRLHAATGDAVEARSAYRLAGQAARLLARRALLRRRLAGHVRRRRLARHVAVAVGRQRHAAEAELAVTAGVLATHDRGARLALGGIAERRLIGGCGGDAARG